MGKFVKERASETLAKFIDIPTVYYDNMFLTGCDVEYFGDLDVIHNHALISAYNICNPRDLNSGLF